MAFVNEFVPEEQKDKFDPEVFEIPPLPPLRPYRWVIDRERDIFLICVGRTGYGGGQGDGYIPPEYFTFSFKKQLIKFEAKVSAYGNKSDGWIIEWEITDLKIPQELEDRQNEIIALLKEAIDMHGNSIGRRSEDVNSINIKLNI